MGDNVVFYTPGTIVWVKYNIVRWPGKVIEFSAIPKDLQQYLKNCVAAIHFSGNDS